MSFTVQSSVFFSDSCINSIQIDNYFLANYIRYTFWLNLQLKLLFSFWNIYPVDEAYWNFVDDGKGE